MVTISWESLVSRSVVRLISRELDLAGSKMKVDTFFSIMIIGAFLLLIGTSYVLYLAFHFFVVFAAIIGLFVGGSYVGILYLLLAFPI
jgi:asparagine N-glycosylation enzyme membrane subunit Stt3